MEKYLNLEFYEDCIVLMQIGNDKDIQLRKVFLYESHIILRVNPHNCKQQKLGQGVILLILERWILIGVIIISLLMILFLVPRNKIRDAVVLFLFLQTITWPAGLFAVEKGWITYPVQPFSNANHINRSSFTFEFFLFPVLAIIFSLYFPNKSKRWIIILYIILFTGMFTGIEVLLERYTDLVTYIKWRWYWTFISVMVTLLLNHIYYSWFKNGFIKGDT